ncbi:MAG: LysR family transcriptional regulator [Planctomycetaceae bacterium]|nr:LysR family transcriptional regulator [Planctomycetaceae bacterium]
MKIDGRSYSPNVLEKAMYMAGTQPAYHLASTALAKVGDISITGRHLGNLAEGIGEELANERDNRTDTYFAQDLPRERTKPDMPIALATVSIDGGRMQTRADGGPNGVQDPHWRETKNALFMRMTGVAFEDDPHPALPECFRDRRYMKKLLAGLADEGDFAPDTAHDKRKSDLQSWRPERLFRTCLSSLCDSHSFGRMMEAEADSRGFFHAMKQAFVADGLQYNWTIQQKHFPTFTPILDFPHAIERIYEVARALHGSSERVWEEYVKWITAVWQGRVADVLQDLRREQSQRGEPPQDCEEKDPRQVLAETITYLENNQSRMDYPRYRREGLPMTSAHMESFVKEIGYRVKGTEKFWNDGRTAEAMLQIRAAVLCEDDRLDSHLRNRPGNPFHPNVKNSLATNLAA